MESLDVRYDSERQEYVQHLGGVRQCLAKHPSDAVAETLRGKQEKHAYEGGGGPVVVEFVDSEDFNGQWGVGGGAGHDYHGGMFFAVELSG
jgi:hypothetical protein